MNRLRPVLRKIYDNIEPNKPLWDLCCDHGLLAEAALKNALVTEAHFVDQSAPVMTKLMQQKAGLKNAYFYFKDATTIGVISSGTIVIAGVGSHTMIKILQATVGHHPLRLLLSTNNKLELLKSYIESKNWTSYVVEESFIEENHRKRPFFRIDLPANDT